MYVSLCVNVSLLCVCSFSLSIPLFICLFVSMGIWQSVCLFICCLSVYPLVCLFIYVIFYLFLYVSTYLFIFVTLLTHSPLLPTPPSHPFSLLPLLLLHTSEPPLPSFSSSSSPSLLHFLPLPSHPTSLFPFPPFPSSSPLRNPPPYPITPPSLPLKLYRKTSLQHVWSNVLSKDEFYPM